MKKYKNKPIHKSNEDIRNEGITLINNAIKARTMSEPLIDSYFCGTADISDANWACYMMQQAIELTLKGLIKYYYEDFREGHFIRYNAKMLEDMSSNIKELREISDILSTLQSGLSVMLFKWESISRYKNLYVNKPQIEQIDSLLNDLMAFIHRHEYNIAA